MDHEEAPHPGDTSYKDSYYSVPRSLSHKHDSEDEEEDKDSSGLSSEDISGLFVTIFPFDPSEKNELKLEVGDLIDVLKTDETGWWKGECLRTQADGWFPSSYVKVGFLMVSIFIYFVYCVLSSLSRFTANSC